MFPLPWPIYFSRFPPLLSPAPVGIAWFVKDDFTDTLAAGSVNGTAATPGPGTRVVVDTGNRLSVGSGLLTGAAGGAAGDPGIWYGSITRELGRTLFFRKTDINLGLTYLGWDVNQTGFPGAGADLNIQVGVIRVNGGNLTVGVPTAAAYDISIILRGTGSLTFIKGGAFTNWTLLYPWNVTSTSPVFPGIQGVVSSTYDFIRVPEDLVRISPLASDSFNRADGGMGSTAGGATEEAGGESKAWTAQAGTWGIASNVAACSALAAGLGIVTVDVGTIHFLAEVELTRSAGEPGLMLRYADANNYIRCIHNGTNVQLIKVVAGVPTTVVNAAGPYAGGRRLVVSGDGTAFRVYYNNLLIGTATIADASLQTGTLFGLYTDDTGNTFDDFAVWARGNGGEYEGTLNPYMA